MLLENINSPADIRNLSIEQQKQLCEEIRQYMVECCAKNPGHLGSSLGAVELIVALHTVYNTPKDKLIFDVGHQAYAHKILTGRREAFRKNRTRDGISGFPKRSETASAASPSGARVRTTPSAPDIPPPPSPRPSALPKRPASSIPASAWSPSWETAPSPAVSPGKA